jgi:hypothetical protein
MKFWLLSLSTTCVAALKSNEYVNFHCVFCFAKVVSCLSIGMPKNLHKSEHTLETRSPMSLATSKTMKGNTAAFEGGIFESNDLFI